MLKVDNSSYNAADHQVGANRLVYILWYFTHALFFINPLNLFSFTKVFLLRLFGAKIGKGVYIKPSARIKYPWKLIVGDHTWIGERVWIDNVESVVIGANVCLSQDALLLTGSHDHTKTTFDYLCAGIILEDGVWIGARSIVGKGVICRSHSILSINSVAEKELEPYVIYKGNPAQAVIKRKIIE